MADLALIPGGFSDYLRRRHTAEFTRALYCRFLRQVARYLAQRGRRRMTELRRTDVPRVIRGCLPGWKDQSRRPRRSGLNQWLKFIGRFHTPARRVRWQPWLDAYAHFMAHDRALAECTRNAALRVVGQYLAWQFRRRPCRWASIRADDLRRYAVVCCRRLSPKSSNDTLSSIRQFLRFMHLRGRCSPMLALAVPTVADFGHQRSREVLTARQRQALLGSFRRGKVQGKRDYAIACCLVDLGLRSVEVSKLRIDGIDLVHRSLAVPPAKTSRGRHLPLPVRVAQALRDYLRCRPSTDAAQVFVGQALLRGRPLSALAVRAVMDRAYRRSGFHGWYGTHRLRHSFATRLHAHGASTKEIADLLGHRRVATTDRYTQTDDLRTLAQPWPLP